MKRTTIFLGVFALFSLILTSCQKYEFGGTTAGAERNIKETWKLESYFLDGVDNTSNLLISNYKETYRDDGTYNRTFNDESGDLKNEEGSWALDNEKSLINVSGIGSFELTNETSTVSASDYTIIKLRPKELWYEFSNGGSTHEFHLVKE